ncbi:MAG: von Willebrand factor type A domain-containing protein [Ruminococcus sp.]|nr:von Willebrand factor type A domain-containing protein [Ruminococcus sp.]MCM1382254.1 von Willebrand factor type A domain-containing protein [Muribaculaceae bacterium]MCM1478520.1 von Willebrand factor type A domain-containing protein [Muribaculaceae bacterium]
MKRKILSGILALIIAIGATPILGTFPALTVSAAVDLDNLPTPIAKSDIEDFQKAKPKLNFGECWGGYIYSYELAWSEVDGALYYEVYRRDPDSKGSYTKIGETLYSNFYIDSAEGEYRVRAVTFTYADKKKYSDYSNTVTVEESEYYREADDEEYEPVDDGYATSEEADYDVGVAAPAETAAVNGVNIPNIPNIPNTEEYSHNEESGYRNPAITPLSTFSADVDTASYANVRRLINDGDSVPEDAVRIEEMLNYFDYGYKKPSKSTFSVSTELTDCPWNSGSQLLKVGIQGKDLAETPASNLVFLIDTSGSMGWNAEEKIELVKKSVNTLAQNLTSEDRISIVTYSGSESVILAGARGNQVKTVAKLTSLLDTNGGTYGEGGINAAYAVAEKYFIKGGNNRIIMMTDGDLNVGISSEDELKKLIGEKRKSGVYFTVLGYGKDNIKDSKMETLADNGNGSYHYIDTAREAYKVLAEERNSTLFTIAGDVKIQVEFNPANVKSYRLIGYDNRRLANEDFTDDTKDAGEVGAGQSVTALYEIIPADGKSGEGLKYQQSTGDTEELLTVKIRFKNPEDGKVKQITKIVNADDYSAEMSDGMKLACAAAEFGLVLKNSDYKGSATAQSALKLAQGIAEPDVYAKELISLIKKYIKNLG